MSDKAGGRKSEVGSQADVPLFSSTEAAEIYGRATTVEQFPTLVRTWMVSELAAREAIDLQAKALLAYRCQTLREAVQAFLFPEGAISREELSVQALMEVGGS